MSGEPGGARAARFDDVPVTVTEAIDVLRRHGYSADFDLVDGVLRSEDCGTECAIDHAVVERFYRFEGPSDPGDQMIVLGLLDPSRQARGTLATAYGPLADPALYEHLSRLGTRRDRRSSSLADAGSVPSLAVRERMDVGESGLEQEQ